HDHAATLPRDARERRAQGPGAWRAHLGAEHIPKRVSQVHAHEWHALAGHVAMHECKMHVTLHVILVRMEAELAEFGPDHALGDTLDRAFVAQTITDEFRDRADLQSVMAREGLELWPPRHRAVVVHHFDDHGSRSEAGE